MGKFNLDDYEPVEQRIKRFWADHEDGGIITDLVSDSGDQVVVRAEIHVGGRLVSSGLAHEVRGKGPVNQTSHIENCETSAIGRALANYGYFGSRRVSREEMEKVERASEQADEKKDTVEMVKKVFGDQKSVFAQIMDLVNGGKVQDKIAVVTKARALKDDPEALAAYHDELIQETLF